MDLLISILENNLTRKLKYLHRNPNEVMLLTYQGSDTSKNFERQNTRYGSEWSFLFDV